MGDSHNFEILSFEEVEALKKERTLLSNRIEGTKRKLALETKLRDAAQSIGRLYSPPSPRSSGEYGANGTKSHRRSRGIFGRNGPSEILDKSDSELAMSQRKCEESAQELWKLERRSQHINQRLLEHTAGVLQLTHKGMKKTPKGADARASGSVYDGHQFDDRSLYRTPEHLDNYGIKGRVELNGPTQPTEAVQATQRRLQELSERMCNMMIQANPDEFVDPPPELHDDASADSTAAIEAQLAYLDNGLHSLRSRPTVAMTTGNPTSQTEGAWKEQLTVVNNRVQAIVDQLGLSRSPTLPPPPAASDGEGLENQLSYLQTGVEGLASRVDGLLEQKSILSTQIQQQRQLNSKSDAERDAHVADLTEQLAHARKDLESRSERELDSDAIAERDAHIADLTEQLSRARNDLKLLSERESARELDAGTIAERNAHIADLTEQLTRARDDLEHSEREGKAARGELAVLTEQLEAMRHDGSTLDEVKASLVQAEGEIARLQSVIESLHGEADSRAEEMREARDRAEQEVAHLEASIQQIRSESDERVKEAIDQRAQAEESANRIQSEMTELEGEVVRTTTELTMVKAELDGAYGTRAQRAAEVAANPEIQKEIDALRTRNIELTEQLAGLKGQPGGRDLQQRADTLEKELRETLEDYEVMTKASIEFEKERERFEGVIDNLRDRSEQLEQQLSEERINWMNLSSPTSMGRDPTLETTSTMVLKNEFKKMMRDTRNENMKILKVSTKQSRSMKCKGC